MTSDAYQVRAGFRSARRQARARLHTAERDARAGLRVAGRHAGPLHGVLGWWAGTSLGMLSLLLAMLLVLWPSSLRTVGAAVVGAWLLFVALGRFGGGQLLRARYGGSHALQAGAAVPALTAVIVFQLPAFDHAVGVAAVSLALGVAAAGDAGAAAQFPSPARGCLWLRAGCGLVAAMAVAAAPATGLLVAAACVGLGEVVLAVRLLPEVERLAAMLDRGAWAGPDDDQGPVLPLPALLHGPAPARPPLG